MQGFALNAPKTMNLYATAGGRLPFLLHTGDRRFPYSNPEQLIPVLESFPETRFIGPQSIAFLARSFSMM